VIHIGGDDIPLEDFGHQLAEWGVDLAGRTLYLGSCSVMGAKRCVIAEFREKTGLDCVCGYAGEGGVDWLESAAFELLLFQALAFSRYAADRFALRDLVAAHRQLAQHLDVKFEPPASAKRGARP
jgi:hypothetical protein